MTKDNAQRELMVSHQSDLLTQDMILTGIYMYCNWKDYGMEFKFPYIRYEHSTGDIFYPTWQVEELKNLEVSKESIERLIKFLENELVEYKDFLKKFKQDINSSKDAPKKIKTYFDKSLKAAATIPYFAYELALSKKLEQEGISPKDIPSTVTYTASASLELERISLKYKNILGKLQDGNKIPSRLKTDLKKFCDKYGYLGMIYFKGNPWTIPEAYRMLYSVVPKPLEEKKRTKQSIYIGYASELLKLRTKKWEAMCYGTFLFRKFVVEKLSYEIVYDELLNLRINELLDLVNGKYQKNDIGSSRKIFALEITDKGVVLSILKDNIVAKETIDVSEIKGVTAQPGIVKGKAKIILSPKDGYKLEPGDILVTKMSTPDFLPIMKKAAAFVTDIGGITSHAAIVSRELKKPCIIGTQIATQVLKDGDYIEVDANKGIVRKIQ